MRPSAKLKTLLPLLLIAALADTMPGQSPGGGAYGPEVRSFLNLCRHEENELDYQIQHNEISRKEYIRSKNRIGVHRETVLRIVRETGVDIVPEVHVVTDTEVDELIEDGSGLLKGLKPGDVVRDRWRYRGKVTRGDLFYIFEVITESR
jgi:hypothetical protein